MIVTGLHVKPWSYDRAVTDDNGGMPGEEEVNSLEHKNLGKTGRTQHAWTSNCKVFIKLNWTPEQAKALVIRNIEELDKYE